MFHTTDLDELLEQVKSTSSREYLGEAITTFRAGSYRSAVAITWVAVCIDIIEKIRELSMDGDEAAKKLETKLNAFPTKDKKKMQDFEASLLEKAEKELNIISTIEYHQLHRIKEDRNLCVHPTFQEEGQHFNISAETARAHIVTACTCLLINTPIKGKVLIEKILARIKENSFPVDIENAFSFLSSDYYLGRAQESVFRNLCIVILKDVFQSQVPQPPHYMKAYASTLHVIERLHPKIFKDTIQEKLNSMVAYCNEPILKQFLVLLKKCPSIMSCLDSEYQTRILALITQFSVEEMIQFDIPETANSSPLIKKYLEQWINEKPEEGLRVAEKIPNKNFNHIIINEFLNAGSFNYAAKCGRELLLPHAQYFTDEELKQVLFGALKNRKFRTNQILRAGGMDEIFVQLYINSKHVKTHATTWIDFWEKLDDYQQAFIYLENALVEDQVIFKKKEEV